MIRTSRKYRGFVLAAASVVALHANFAHADPTWTNGGGDSLWGNPTNWNGGVPSGASFTADLPLGLATNIDLGGVLQTGPSILHVDDAYTLSNGTFSGVSFAGPGPGVATLAANATLPTTGSFFLINMSITGTLYGTVGVELDGSNLLSPATYTRHTLIRGNGATLSATGAFVNTSTLQLGGPLNVQYAAGSVDRIADAAPLLFGADGQLNFTNSGASSASENIATMTLQTGMAIVSTKSTGGGQFVLTTQGVVRQQNATMSLVVGGGTSFRATNVPAQVGGGAANGSPSMSIIPWMFSNDGNFAGLTTYDPGPNAGDPSDDVGFRPLNTATEYASLTPGPSPHNVRVAGFAALSSDAMMNALVLHGGAIQLTNNANLAVTSGAIVLANSNPPSAGATPGTVANIFGAGQLSAPGEMIIHADGPAANQFFEIDVPVSAASLTKSGNANLILGQPNTLPFGVVINTGTLLSAVNGALGNATVSLRGGNLSIVNFSQDIGGSNGLVSEGGNSFPIDNGGTNVNHASYINVNPGLVATVNGPLSGSVGLAKVGTGRLRLLSNNPNFTGSLFVPEGVVELDGSLGTRQLGTGFNFVSGATGNSPGILTGNGDVAGSVIVVSLEPGVVVGRLKADRISETSTQHLTIDIAGSGVAGTDYDQLVYISSMQPGGSTLNVNLLNGFTPALATVFTIIDQQPLTGGGSKISSRFAGLPDASVFAAGSSFFRIDYLTNGDVTLTTVVPEPSLALAAIALPMFARRRRRPR